MYHGPELFRDDILWIRQQFEERWFANIKNAIGRLSYMSLGPINLYSNYLSIFE